jgi:P27 family predicted phage terminase small subunit
MGKRGPQAKEKELVVIPLKGKPRPPDWLDEEGKAHWSEMADLLEESGQASKLDADCLALYLSHYSTWREAERELAKPPSQGGGKVITAINGYQQLSPWYTISLNAQKAMKLLLTELGLEQA